ncbi:fumarylacetoacetate hydrolase family protein [Roseibium sp.]|uniref:fumarylacetoacetate hydrolase family protein n=1 Tax=Roseibium sp. TaxID=1936156 RepID=UPI003A96BA71
MTNHTGAPLTASDILPLDENALLIGRVWRKDVDGPSPVLVDGLSLRDLTGLALTTSQLLELPDLAVTLTDMNRFPVIGTLDDFVSGKAGSLLAPCDLQAVKAAGVTFADSMVERVIEEQAKGDPARAEEIRGKLKPIIGENLKGVQAGSEQAAEVKRLLQDLDLWSQYLEVGIGPDAEVFTKALPMSSVGCGAEVGIHPISDWNNPEPEVVLAIRSDSTIVGATLGNDVNLRDVEGRSALLLGKAKDNNASCAIGPFIRLFDANFTLEDVGKIEVSLKVTGESDGFEMEGVSQMSAISRSPADLASQTLNIHHQYPDGAMLFLGTMFAPVKDRRAPGQGFTHEIGDQVNISSPALGTLVNWVDHTNAIAPWTFGTAALFTNLAKRGLLS